MRATSYMPLLHTLPEIEWHAHSHCKDSGSHAVSHIEAFPQANSGWMISNGRSNSLSRVTFVAFPEPHCRIGCKRVKSGFPDFSEFKDATDDGDILRGVHRHSGYGCVDQRWLHKRWHCKGAHLVLREDDLANGSGGSYRVEQVAARSTVRWIVDDTKDELVQLRP